jgi:hypothetical protein
MLRRFIVSIMALAVISGGAGLGYRCYKTLDNMQSEKKAVIAKLDSLQ